MNNTTLAFDIRKKIIEKRKQKRHQVSINQDYAANVSICINNKNLNFIIGNISFTGIGVIVVDGVENLELYDVYDSTIRLFKDGETVKIKAAIRHISLIKGSTLIAGMEFLDPLDDDLERIHKFIESCIFY